MEENKKETEYLNNEEKKFTQAEVDEIVKNRLGRERRKQGEDIETNLSARELKLTAKEKLLELGLPRKWAELLRYDNEEELDDVLSELQTLTTKKEESAPSSKSWGQRQKGTLKKDDFREAFGLPK